MTQYHVTLDSQGYLLDLTTYHKSIAPTFAAQTREGSAGYEDLAQAAIWAQSSWEGGLSFLSWDPEHPDTFYQGPAIEVGNGYVRPGPEITTVFNPGGGLTDLGLFATYNNKVYCPRRDGTNLYESSNASSWSSVYAPGSVNGWRGIGLFNGLLLIGSSSNGEVHSWNGAAGAVWGTVSGAPLSIDAIKEYWTAYGSRLCYLGVSKSTSRASLYSASTAPAFTEIAETPYDRIEALEVWSGVLWVAALTDTNGHRGALYTYDGSSFELITTLFDNAITSFAVYRERLYAGSATRGKVWEVSTSGLTEVFTVPDVVGIGGVSAYSQDLRQMIVHHDRLYVPVADANGLGVYVFNGTGWSNLATGGPGQESRGVGVHNGIIVQSNKSNAGARILTHSTTNFLSGAVLVSPWFDAELGGATKALVRATVRHSALASGEAIQLDYELDESGVWTTLMTSDTDGALSKTATFASQTTCSKFRLRTTFTMSTTTAAPKLYEVLVEYAVAPALKATWTFDVLLEGTAEMPLITLDHAQDPKTGAQLADTLWASAAKAYPLSFTDLDGESKTVYFRDLEERVAPQSQRRGYCTRARVTLVEA